MVILDKAFACKKGVSSYFMNDFKIAKFVDNSFEIDVRADINNETVGLHKKKWHCYLKFQLIISVYI